MWGRVIIVALFAALIANLGMKSIANASNPTCHVVAAEKLPQSVKADRICAEVARAIRAEAPTVRYTAEIRVISRSRLTATLVVEDRMLPVQNFAVMDRNLNDWSIGNFARALAAEVAKAAKP